jgi:hypothetical protein
MRRAGTFQQRRVLRDIGGCTEHGRPRMVRGDGLRGRAGRLGVAREFLAPVSPRRAAAPVTPPRHVSTLPRRPARPTLSADFSTTSEFFHVHLGDPRGHLNVHAEPSAPRSGWGGCPMARTCATSAAASAGGRTWCDVMQAGGGVSGWVAAEYLRDGHTPGRGHHPHRARRVPSPSDFADGMEGGPGLLAGRPRPLGQRAARAHASVDSMRRSSRGSMTARRCATPAAAG